MNKKNLTQLIGKQVQHLKPPQNLTIINITEKVDNKGNIDVNFRFNKKFKSNTMRNVNSWTLCNYRYFFENFRLL
tara:strand:- start:157237 stop:157461 length:225 start_codon:yes stop_codon:yes gene_type:complete